MVLRITTLLGLTEENLPWLKKWVVALYDEPELDLTNVQVGIDPPVAEIVLCNKGRIPNVRDMNALSVVHVSFKTKKGFVEFIKFCHAMMKDGWRPQIVEGQTGQPKWQGNVTLLRGKEFIEHPVDAVKCKFKYKPLGFKSKPDWNRVDSALLGKKAGNGSHFRLWMKLDATGLFRMSVLFHDA